jgi:leader peptidase (prepilin peptidase) / N-methyltransferase
MAHLLVVPTVVLAVPAPLVPLVPALLVTGLLASGLVAGTGARLLLRRLRRGTRVPPPWCELGVAATWAGVGVATRVGPVPVRWLPVLLALAWLAVAAGAVDVLCGRLPDALTLPALPIALLLLAPVGVGAVGRAVAGAAVAVAAHAAVHLVAPAAMGAGDVKLAAPLGAVLAAASWEALALAGLLAALCSGALAGAVLLVRRRGGAVPHGPSMLVAGLLVATAGARGP